MRGDRRWNVRGWRQSWRGSRGGAEIEWRSVFKCELVLMSLVRVWNSLFKAAIILINVVNEPLIAVMDLTLQLTHTHTGRGTDSVCVCVCVQCYFL